ncbi:hypothetical protein DSM101010T_19400 [Desulfovibrio subterraneus]|uniref:Uncharacterized protein n=1 Tax=Desulfovibrio subterraneus TaxID=2718620 RepID=A0A7J0BKC5_9BACT|nr:hypothetical protein DSM101010T_19400 [Desulfovibrio subterraneus]
MKDQEAPARGSPFLQPFVADGGARFVVSHGTLYIAIPESGSDAEQGEGGHEEQHKGLDYVLCMNAVCRYNLSFDTQWPTAL